MAVAVDEAAAHDDDSDSEAARRIAWVRYHVKLGNYKEATDLGWEVRHSKYSHSTL